MIKSYYGMVARYSTKLQVTYAFIFTRAARLHMQGITPQMAIPRQRTASARAAHNVTHVAYRKATRNQTPPLPSRRRRRSSASPPPLNSSSCPNFNRGTNSGSV
uniref:Uncharacterized protein n=1 Tax=Oryza sativa subsp. japonica TaxID=39947 RepID=Q69QG2_ORYSJ|nr:hypothetical protein [Oryza sativa Japonica Group]